MPRWKPAIASRLFDRVGRRIELNAAGQLFLGEARAILARAAAAELVLSELSGLKRGTLSVHASQTIASYWLSPRLVAFRHAYPQIEVKLAVGNTAQTAKAVIDGLPNSASSKAASRILRFSKAPSIRTA